MRKKRRMNGAIGVRNMTKEEVIQAIKRVRGAAGIPAEPYGIEGQQRGTLRTDPEVLSGLQAGAGGMRHGARGDGIQDL